MIVDAVGKLSSESVTQFVEKERATCYRTRTEPHRPAKADTRLAHSGVTMSPSVRPRVRPSN